jgi:hypothetical protein
VPTVAADGKIYVSFLNTTDLATGRDDYEVVRVSPATGAPVTAPVKVATVIDGFTDYPVALGRQTYQDSVFRSWAAGNITADPTNASHLAVVWSDMRNSPPPSPDLNPYTSVTNSDVIVTVDRRRRALVGRRSYASGTSSSSGPRSTITASCGSAPSTAAMTRQITVPGSPR